MDKEIDKFVLLLLLNIKYFDNNRSKFDLERVLTLYKFDGTINIILKKMILEELITENRENTEIGRLFYSTTKKADCLLTYNEKRLKETLSDICTTENKKKLASIFIDKYYQDKSSD